MKIGLSTSVIQRGKSGVGQYVLSLVRGLLDEARRHEFTLFVLEEDMPLFSFAGNAMKIVSVSERHRPAVKDILWHQLELPSLAKRLGLDVLHVPSYRRLLWRRPCAQVATIHDLAPFRVPKKYDFRRMLYGKLVVPRLARRQDAIITVSKNTADDIERYFGSASQATTVIHNGIDHSRFHPGSKSEARRAVALKHGIDQPFFLYVARIEHPAKNHVRLLEAFDLYKQNTRSPWKLVLGGSDWHGAEIVHQRVTQSPFARDVHSLGFVPDAELPRLYQAAEIFVYPSLFEGFGLPPVEAMACACPVLSSSCGALAEVLGDAAEIIDPNDSSDLARKMELLASDGEKRLSLQARGLRQAALFDWDRTAAATLEVYESAVKKFRGPSFA